jgi:hypothetical protein
MPKMTRAHFQLLADIFAEVRPSSVISDEYDQWAQTVEKFATRLKATNPNFQAGRFVDACVDE